ncbi:MAG: A24 family peptidase [Weeksellaceae bacterium]
MIIEYVMLAVTGLFFGSFLNVLADRLSREESIMGRSYCESCKHVLEWKDLIPVVSYLYLKGKCRYCKAPFTSQYPLAELFTSGMYVLVWYLSNLQYGLVSFHILHIVVVSILIVILLADLRYQIIPDEMQIALIVVAVVRLFIVGFAFDILLQQLLAGMIAFLPLLALFLITKGRGMGFGDVKLAFGIGFYLGLWNGLLALYIGFLSGGIIGAAILLLKKGDRKTKIAFGPFLVVGFFVMVFFEGSVSMLLKLIYNY